MRLRIHTLYRRHLVHVEGYKRNYVIVRNKEEGKRGFHGANEPSDRASTSRCKKNYGSLKGARMREEREERTAKLSAYRVYIYIY